MTSKTLDLLEIQLPPTPHFLVNTAPRRPDIWLMGLSREADGKISTIQPNIIGDEFSAAASTYEVSDTFTIPADGSKNSQSWNCVSYKHGFEADMTTTTACFDDKYNNYLAMYNGSDTDSAVYMKILKTTTVDADLQIKSGGSREPTVGGHFEPFAKPPASLTDCIAACAADDTCTNLSAVYNVANKNGKEVPELSCNKGVILNQSSSIPINLEIGKRLPMGHIVNISQPPPHLHN